MHVFFCGEIIRVLSLVKQLCNWPFEVRLSGSDVKDSDMSLCEDSDGMQYVSSQKHLIHFSVVFGTYSENCTKVKKNSHNIQYKQRIKARHGNKL